MKDRRRYFGSSGSPFAGTVPVSTVLACVLIGGASAQPPTNNGDPNTVMGFETPTAWMVKGDSTSLPIASSTTTRTEGKAAFAISKPAELTTLTSTPVASIERALSGVGQAGAEFEVDIALPALPGSPVNRGSLQMFVTCPSRKLGKTLVGKADFDKLRHGLYTTIKFPIPDSVRSALADKISPTPIPPTGFKDLTFEFALQTAGPNSGTYVFDNLRVHSVAVATGDSNHPPAGYGGSVDLVATGNVPASQAFAAGPVQVPDSFHLKVGSAGATHVQLHLGYDGTPAFTCTYQGDSSDRTGKTYTLMSCTGGLEPGDLIGASWAGLTIVGGDATMQIRAQLAMRPVGDLVGGGVIPPMPTFWGDSDGCIVAPVKGKLVTTSLSCANQAAQASQIVTAYFNKVIHSNTDPEWVVTPSPEYARRNGNGSPPNTPPSSQPLKANDPPFDLEGHINPGSDWDAYWRLYGNLTNNTTPDNHYQTHLDASFGGHLVLNGNDVTVAGLNSAIDTDTGEIKSDGTGPAHYTGSIHMTLFGADIGGQDIDGTSGFEFHLSDKRDFDLPPIPIWIFSITLGATAEVGVDTTGNLSPTGFRVNVTPYATMGGHIAGEVDIVIAAGGVDVRVNLIEVSTPLDAQASWRVDTSPTACSSRLDFSLKGYALVSAGGGEVDLVARFGYCPFCKHASWKLFDWSPIAKFVPVGFDAGTSFQNPLNPALCQAPLAVTITSQSTAPSDTPILLQGSAYSTNAGLPVPCSGLHWTVSSGSLSSSTGCSVYATFGSSPLPATITLNADDQFKNQYETIEEKGSRSKSITIVPLPRGIHITQAIPLGEFPATIDGSPGSPLDGDTLTIHFSSRGQVVQFVGAVSPANPTYTNTWTATDEYGSKTTGTGLIFNWSPDRFVYYSIQLVTTDSSGNLVGFTLIGVNAMFNPR